MKTNRFQTLTPNVDGNSHLREPQRLGFQAIVDHFAEANDREASIVLPVGCGKSGLITISPFALRSDRTLVVAPNLNIADQLLKDFLPSENEMFYRKCAVLSGTEFPETVEIRGDTSNRDDLDFADVVITNIHQLQGDDNQRLQDLPPDFFDLILFDEGHHSVADSWRLLRERFPQAKIINFSATPTRSDGKLMEGHVIYSYPVSSAIAAGFIKRLKAVVLNPKTLRYVREEDGREVTVDLDEVKRLGEDDAQFRRSIVSSPETLNTIVDASLRELDRIRTETCENKHKIIASALNQQHCIQIVEAYQARGRKAAYIHTKEDGRANERAIQKLKNHELDVIVQVRKLGEGFDHKYLSVAAVFSIYSHLSPFVQFVGRIMRVVDQNDPTSINNQGTVVFHIGGNIARRWSDFQTYSVADQTYFDQLLPTEELAFGDASELEITPGGGGSPTVPKIDIRSQEQISIEVIPLLDKDPKAQKALEYLRQIGFTSEDFRKVEELQPVPTTRQKKRQAARSALDSKLKTVAGQILAERGQNPMGKGLDKQRRNRTNFQVVKSALDHAANALVGQGAGSRAQFTQADLEQVKHSIPALKQTVISEVFNGTS